MLRTRSQGHFDSDAGLGTADMMSLSSRCVVQAVVEEAGEPGSLGVATFICPIKCPNTSPSLLSLKRDCFLWNPVAVVIFIAFS